MTEPRYRAERRATLAHAIRRYIPDVHRDDAVVEDVLAILESEVHAAYGRGLRAQDAPTRQERPRRPGEIRSAVANGRLRPTRRADQEGA